MGFPAPLRLPSSCLTPHCTSKSNRPTLPSPPPPPAWRCSRDRIPIAFSVDVTEEIRLRLDGSPPSSADVLILTWLLIGFFNTSGSHLRSRVSSIASFRRQHNVTALCSTRTYPPPGGIPTRRCPSCVLPLRFLSVFICIIYEVSKVYSKYIQRRRSSGRGPPARSDINFAHNNVHSAHVLAHLSLIWHLVKQLGHALSIVTAPDHLGKHASDVNYLDFVAPRHVLFLWQRVGDDQLLQRALLNVLQRLAAQDPMGDEPEDAQRTRFGEVLRGEAKGTARIGHVIDENCNLALDMPDEDHPRYFICFFALLVE